MPQRADDERAALLLAADTNVPYSPRPIYSPPASHLSRSASLPAAGANNVNAHVMDTALILLLIAFVAWQLLRARYQRERIAFLAQHLTGMQLERHMETLTQGYSRAINESDENRQLQVLETFATAERAAAGQVQALADAMKKASPQATAIAPFPFCVPYAERFLPVRMRDFRQLLQVHAAGLRHAVENESGWDPKTRAFHVAAELYLFQHSCHWFCKSRLVADARLQVRHQLSHQKVVESVSERTRAGYLWWMTGEQA